MLKVVLAQFFLAAAHADTIAFLYALDADLVTLKGDAPSRSIDCAGTNVQEFAVGHHKILAARMGAGNIETAISAANLLGRFPADLVISVGPAGALQDDLQIGEWFQVTKVIGYQRGRLDTTGWILSPEAVFTLPTPQVQLEAKPKALINLSRHALASGDAFITNPSEQERVRNISKADAVDMNTFGLAVAVDALKIPLIVWKVVSDKADASASEDFKSFIQRYKGEGGTMVRDFIEHLPSSPSSPDRYENIRKALIMGQENQPP